MTHRDAGTGTPRRGGRLLRRIVLGLVVVAAALYVAGYALASDRLPRETTVAGVDVGGMRPERAERVLRARIASRLDDPVEVVVGKRAFTLDPEDTGLDVDVPASVAQAPVGRSWNPTDMWEVAVGGGDYAPVVIADDRLTRRLERIAAQVGKRVVEGGVDFRGARAVPTYPTAGAELDVAGARAAVLAAYPSAGWRVQPVEPAEPVELSLEEVEPAVSRREVRRFMGEVARPAMSAPVTLVVSGEEVVLGPAEFSPALRVVADGRRLVAEAAPRRLMGAIRPSLRTVSESPRDATFRIVAGRPRVVPSRQGVTVDQSAIEEAFLRMVTARGDARRRVIPTTRVPPRLTTAEARALRIREQVSEFTTYYPHADYRNINIGRAAELVDGTVLEPGEVFSLNQTVGERTRENGFTEGFVISDGVFKEDLGGGVSQIATTTFNAMFFAGLEDVEHKPHSFYIDRYPVGREATVAWPSVDLRFRNDTDYGVLVTTDLVPSSYANQGAVTVRMWSTRVWDISSRTGERYAYTSPDTRYLSGDDCVPNEGYGGFSIDVVRVFRRAGERAIERTERFHTTYTPSDSVVCR